MPTSRRSHGDCVKIATGAGFYGTHEKPLVSPWRFPAAAVSVVELTLSSADV